MICCNHCGQEVVRSYGDEKKIKLRTNIIVWNLDTGECICKCLKCKGEVEVPLFLKLSDGRIIGEDKNGKKRKKA